MEPQENHPTLHETGPTYDPVAQKDNIIVMKDITRRFGTLVANDNITLELRRGEIHALLGENGAGKSTLMSILFGLIPPSEGEIYLDGKKITIKDPNDATRYGIGMVHQHFMLVDVFTGLENIILGHEDCGFLGKLRVGKARTKIESLMTTYGLHVDLNEKVQDMSVSMQQKVEILKMLYRDSNILIFDEPTAVLTEAEIEDLMQVILSLKKEGKTILFISHKLNEVRQISDRITILRRGKDVGTFLTPQTTNDQLAELMVGKHVSFTIEKTPANPGAMVLEVKDLCVKKEGQGKLAVNHLNLTVRKGEIISILGVDGNGQDELVGAIVGLSKVREGKIFLEGKDITHKSIRKRNHMGIAHIPGDRHRYGLILDYNVMYNFIQEQISDNKRFSMGGFLKNKAIYEYSQELIEKYDIRSALGSYTMTRSMSGGNQQKIIVAREIERNSDLLICVQPTRGLDVGAIENIHRNILHVRDTGHAILLVSLEIDEVFDLADTIYTLYEGRITGRFDPKQTTYKEIGLYMTGAKCQDEFQVLGKGGTK
jgi:general nucleoside transport system ATP-binding protein